MRRGCCHSTEKGVIKVQSDARDAKRSSLRHSHSGWVEWNVPGGHSWCHVEGDSNPVIKSSFVSCYYEGLDRKRLDHRTW